MAVRQVECSASWIRLDLFLSPLSAWHEWRAAMSWNMLHLCFLCLHVLSFFATFYSGIEWLVSSCFMLFHVVSWCFMCAVLLAIHQSVKSWASANTQRPCCSSRLHLKASRWSFKETGRSHREMCVSCTAMWKDMVLVTSSALKQSLQLISLQCEKTWSLVTINTLHHMLRETNETRSCIPTSLLCILIWFLHRWGESL